jgi:hypothetical protein
VADGTPRDCTSGGCGAQADASIIDDDEIADGECGPLGYTEGRGNVVAETMMMTFMGVTSNGFAGNTNGFDSDSNDKRAAARAIRFFRRQQLNATAITMGEAAAVAAANQATGNNNDDDDDDDEVDPESIGALAVEFPLETLVSETAGTGAQSGLPTCSDDGVITLTYRQINGDGAGPLEAAVDGTSGGTEVSAFQTATVLQNVPGNDNFRSDNDNSNFNVEVAMPAGMTCDGTVANVENVCIVRVRNGARAGPFGGSAAFTQSAVARKRAISYRMKKRAEEYQSRRGQ